MKKLIKESFAVIRQHKRAYIIINLIFCGFYIAGLITGYLFPDLNAYVNELVNFMANNSLRFAPQIEYYYTNPNFVLAVFVTFILNLLISCLFAISVSSTIIPFIGCIFAALEYFYFGVWAPKPHVYPILILELLPTVLAVFGVYVHYKHIIKPQSYGLASRKQGFIEGLKIQARLYPLITILWLIAAIVEVMIVFTKDTPPDPFASRPLAIAQAPDKLLSTPETRSIVLYDTTIVAEADARNAGEFLEDVNYFRKSKRGCVRISERNGIPTLEIGIKKDNWNSKIAGSIFSKLLGKMEEYSPARKYQIIMFDIDSSGNTVEQVFKEE